MKNNKKNLLTIGLLVVIVVLIGVFVSKGNSNLADDQSAAAHGATVYCADSDGGVNLTTQGTARTYTLAHNGSQTTVSTMTDSCTTTSTVTEYSCTGSAITSTQGTCSTGNSCVNGACVASTGGTGGTGGSGGSDTTAPTVSLKSPTEGKVFCPSTAYFSDTITDNVSPFPTTGVTFYVDGALWNPATPSPIVFYSPNEYGMSLSGSNPGQMPAIGNHNIYSKACDAAGNCTTTATANFSVASMCTS